MIWSHLSGLQVIIEKTETVKQLAHILNQQVANSVKKPGELGMVLRGLAKRRYGWSLDENSEKISS
jgi:hypothetical protein